MAEEKPATKRDFQDVINGFAQFQQEARDKQDDKDTQQYNAEQGRLLAIGKELKKANKTQTKALQAERDQIKKDRTLRKQARGTQKREFELRKSGLDEQKKAFEAQGLRAEDNEQFRKESFKLQKDELNFRIKNATSPAAREELKKERRELMEKQTEGLLGLKNAVVSGFQGVANKEVPGLGLRLGDLAKLALIPAFIAFLKSPVWQDIKAFIVDPSFEKLGELFKEYPVQLGSLVAIVGGFAIVKTVTLFTKLFTALSAFSSGIATIAGFFGIGSLAAALPIIAIVAGIVLAIKGLYDAFQVFNTTLEETGSVGEALKAAAVEFISVLALPFDLLKSLIKKIGELFGFDMSFLDKFSFRQILRDAINVVFGKIGEIFGGLKQFFTADNPKDRLMGLFGAAGSLIGLVTLPIKAIITAIGKLFNFTAGMLGIDFDIIEFVKEKAKAIFSFLTGAITKAVEKLKNFKDGILSFFGFGKDDGDDKVKAVGVKETDINKEQTGGLIAPGQMSIVGEAGAELIMSKSPVQVFNESRTDALGAAALNNLMTGGGMGGGGNIIAPVNQVQNNTHQSIVRPISNQDPIVDKMTSSLAI